MRAALSPRPVAQAAPVDVSVVIVTYNVREFLEQALESVQRASAGLTVETWVVDNDSADGTAAMVRARFPDVHLIANEENIGFARANNQALREAAGPIRPRPEPRHDPPGGHPPRARRLHGRAPRHGRRRLPHPQPRRHVRAREPPSVPHAGGRLLPAHRPEPSLPEQPHLRPLQPDLPPAGRGLRGRRAERLVHDGPPRGDARGGGLWRWGAARGLWRRARSRRPVRRGVLHVRRRPRLVLPHPAGGLGHPLHPSHADRPLQGREHQEGRPAVRPPLLRRDAPVRGEAPYGRRAERGRPGRLPPARLRAPPRHPRPRRAGRVLAAHPVRRCPRSGRLARMARPRHRRAGLVSSARVRVRPVLLRRRPPALRAGPRPGHLGRGRLRAAPEAHPARAPRRGPRLPRRGDGHVPAPPRRVLTGDGSAGLRPGHGLPPRAAARDAAARDGDAAGARRRQRRRGRAAAAARAGPPPARRRRLRGRTRRGLWRPLCRDPRASSATSCASTAPARSSSPPTR